MDFLIQGIFMAQVINEWMFRPIRLFFMVQVRDIFLLCGECVVNDYNARYLFTMGIMKCKRYLYANMEVNGQRFSYE